MTLLAITLIRLLTVYIPGNRVWVSDLIVGVLFVAAGIVGLDRSASTGPPRPRPTRHDRGPPGRHHRLRARPA